MKIFTRGLLTAAFVASIGASPAFAAQSTSFDTLLLAQASFEAQLAAAVAACRGEAASEEVCGAAVAAYVAAVRAAGLDVSDADDRLADLIVALATDASTLPAGIRAIVAGAIQNVAVAFTDPQRATVAAAVAAAVAVGEDIETDPLYLSASPTV
ncbi:MAG: hypothetical protein EOP22_02135 [Hyphomicrobiales bacterium]|nr:MAG: hypothetical protein EOP22_02135 [Hyphomicrobiales bacterium]